MEFSWTKYLSTKFLLASASLGTGFFLVFKGFDIGAFTGLVATILGFYNGANVAQDYFFNRKEVALSKAENNVSSPTPQVVINTAQQSETF